jgi:hypothetical protein
MPTKGAWVVIGYIPNVTFTDITPTHVHTVFKDRLFHQCVEYLLEPLIIPGKDGIEVSNFLGNIRLGYPRVAAWLADYPEQLLINAAAGKNSPTTIAGSRETANDRRCEARTHEWIISQIAHACAKKQPDNIEAYIKEAKAHGLNGVHRPFWRNLPGYAPELCLSPDLLHNMLRFWRDHILKWVRLLVGKIEFDRRLSLLQPVVGYRHFNVGVKNLSQWSGREDRELQRVLVAVVAGAKRIGPRAMQNIRAFHDFAYLVQYHSHDTDTLRYLSEALQDFHSTKSIYIEEGVRRGKKKVMNHFNGIPKMAGFHDYVPHIMEMGSSPQFSSEITEYNHQPMAKQAYRRTNRKDFGKQMCRFLDRRDRISRQFELIAWCKEQAELESKERDNLTLNAFLASYSPSYRAGVLALANPLAVADGSSNAIFVQNRYKDPGVWLKKRPHHPKVELPVLARAYRLPSLENDVAHFIERNSGTYTLSHFLPGPNSDLLPRRDLTIGSVDVWKNLCIRLPTVQNDDEMAPPHTVEALPPSHGLPYGRAHFVLVHCGEEAEPVGVEGE